ncbi:MAG: hypothetical protein L6R39_004336 [Caloplaca ligustica]|nr:MAG: hypothetical protein L6R39_004336 [Caloplaca ligustica]
MNCQKCRAPLKLDGSLQDLSPSAFDLLTGSRGHIVEPTTSTSRIPFPQERKDLYDKASQDALSPIFKRVIPPPHNSIGSQPAVAASPKAGFKDNPAMSFVMLSESQVVPPQAITNNYSSPNPKHKANAPNLSPDTNQPTPLSQQIESSTRLFEILSARSDIDHPICTECTDLLLTSLQSRLSSAQKERDAYISFLKSLNNTAPSPSELHNAQKSLSEARAAEQKAFSDLLALEKEKADLDVEVAELEAESMALDAEEQEFWRKRNAFALTLSEFQNERDALNAAYDHDAQQLERLQRTNVYNDCFCISHDGHFGTINGLRLGRLAPPQNVEWAEINAALGTAALLLATVADKLGFQFRGYRIKPMGSTSTIEKVEVPSSSSTATASQASSTATITPAATAPSSPSHSQPKPDQNQKITSLDLFSSGDLPLGANKFLHRRLDAGLTAFLDCIRQLGEFVEQSAASMSPSSNTSSPTTKGLGIVKLPYEIKKDKIHGVSIRLGAGTDETWTRACKYALTCCKFLLAHASNVGGRAGKGVGG